MRRLLFMVLLSNVPMFSQAYQNSFQPWDRPPSSNSNYPPQQHSPNQFRGPANAWNQYPPNYYSQQQPQVSGYPPYQYRNQYPGSGSYAVPPYNNQQRIILSPKQKATVQAMTQRVLNLLKYDMDDQMQRLGNHVYHGIWKDQQKSDEAVKKQKATQKPKKNTPGKKHGPKSYKKSSKMRRKNSRVKQQ